VSFTNTPGSCQTSQGRYIEPCNPLADDIDILDVGHHLSLSSRWGGICNDMTEDRNPVFYSVAQHSCHVHDIVVRRFGSIPAFYALMHDGSEAYLCDIPRPIKPLLTNYYEIEAQLMGVLLAKFGVTLNDEIKKQVVEIDNAMIFWERDALCGAPANRYANEHQHPGGTIFDEIPNFTPWSPRRAKAEFLMRFTYHTQFIVEVGTDAFDAHLLNITNDNIGLTSKWAGLGHLDFPKVA
jgi:5'-deoxynucleotidase YfbR-like HD superfamily hydrolase